jgi:hypothetical protein
LSQRGNGGYVEEIDRKMMNLGDVDGKSDDDGDDSGSGCGNIRDGIATATATSADDDEDDRETSIGNRRRQGRRKVANVTTI